MSRSSAHGAGNSHERALPRPPFSLASPRPPDGEDEGGEIGALSRLAEARRIAVWSLGGGYDG